MTEEPEVPWLDLGEAEVDSGLLHLVGNRTAFEQLRKSIDLALGDSAGAVAVGDSSMSIASLELVMEGRDFEEPGMSWVDRVLTLGCLAIVIGFVLCAIFGFFQMVELLSN